MRTFPGSRRYPQFNKSELSASLAGVDIQYKHEPRLGGRRTARKDSHNTAWRNASFRGYADHMETDEFKKGLHELLEVCGRVSHGDHVRGSTVVAMSSQSHLRFLKAAGHTVIHIVDAKKSEEHSFTSAANIVDGELSYRGLLG